MSTRAYIAGIGMVTPLGINFPMTAASVKASISGYSVSDYLADDGQPVTMSMVPDAFFDSVNPDIDEGDVFGAQYERVIKMAIVALKEAINSIKTDKPVPLILAFPEQQQEYGHTYPDSLKVNLLAQDDLPFTKEQTYGFYTGRSGGAEAVNMALRLLYDQGHEYVVLGASDSYYQCPRLFELKEKQRLLTRTNSDGFAPGEAAGFVVLTRNRGSALMHNGKSVVLYESGVAEEKGHILSEVPYLGEALDWAISKALASSSLNSVDILYSSMNGERYWSKELGVTMMRSLRGTTDTFRIEHPSDCYGDIGTASAPVLMGLAVNDLFRSNAVNSCIIYSSSDGPGRAATVLQKI